MRHFTRFTFLWLLPIVKRHHLFRKFVLLLIWELADLHYCPSFEENYILYFLVVLEEKGTKFRNLWQNISKYEVKYTSLFSRILYDEEINARATFFCRSNCIYYNRPVWRCYCALMTNRGGANIIICIVCVSFSLYPFCVHPFCHTI